jgi:hypothetical protein
MRFAFILGIICQLTVAMSSSGQSDADVPASKSTSAGHAEDKRCGACHEEKLNSFRQTAHYHTSSFPDVHSILGNFAPGQNIVRTSNPDLFFQMDQKSEGFFETAIQGMAPYTTERDESISVVVGSGGKGQTYLFWKGDQLFQLPISYWRQLGWVNSPGYRDGTANFDRPIIPRCLECHATYAESNPPPANRYIKDSLLLGITCEKCHGPGLEHVESQTSKTKGKAEGAILNPRKFARDRQMDLCGWCHAGAGEPLKPTFSYLPNQPLNAFLKLPEPAPDAIVDVHGGQVELLKRSQCYQSSDMTCITCHDVHAVQLDPSAFSKRCLSCHKPGTAKFPKADHKAESDCVECHMPAQATSLIVFDSKGKKSTPLVRNHWIKVYAAAAERSKN